MHQQTQSEKTNRRATIFQHGKPAGQLYELSDGTWEFAYNKDYHGDPVSLTLPYREETFSFPAFPSVFEGLLPEGPQLEALLRKHKIDREDYFRQLITVGKDLIGSLVVIEVS